MLERVSVHGHLTESDCTLMIVSPTADIVANVLVKNISMSNAQNGARIKIFGGSNDTNSISGGGSGYVRNVTFQDFYNYSTSCLMFPRLRVLIALCRGRQSNLPYIVRLSCSHPVRAELTLDPRPDATRPPRSSARPTQLHVGFLQVHSKSFS